MLLTYTDKESDKKINGQQNSHSWKRTEPGLGSNPMAVLCLSCYETFNYGLSSRDRKHFPYI